MAKDTIYTVSAGTMLLVFFVLEAILFCFGDLFTFIVGTIILILVFANGYDRAHHVHEDGEYR